jgi:hypothetical protein
MKGNRAALLAVVVLILAVAGWWLFKRAGGGEPIDLIASDRFAAAKKQPSPDLFALADVALGGDTRRAIAVQPVVGSRLTWRIRVPDDGWLDLAVGLRPEAWTQEGNGVLFRVGVSDGRAYEEMFTLHLNPFANAGERKWVPIMADLSAYSGEEIDLIFNTNSSSPGQEEDHRNDLAVWAAPKVIVR